MTRLRLIIASFALAVVGVTSAVGAPTEPVKPAASAAAVKPKLAPCHKPGCVQPTGPGPRGDGILPPNTTRIDKKIDRVQTQKAKAAAAPDAKADAVVPNKARATAP
jgi:hypothetical protein